MKQSVRGVGVGTVSLVLIFAVLCLTVFSVLTLSTANADKIMTNRTVEFVTGYYHADAQATRITAHILNAYKDGTFPSNVRELEAAFDVEFKLEPSEFDLIYVSFLYKINNALELSVKLRLAESSGTILEWRIRNSRDWEIDDTLPVWDGAD